MRYVALGDSYTIGTSVGAAERWPEQLVPRCGSATPPRARREPRGERLHLARPHPRRAAAPRPVSRRSSYAPDRRQRRRPGRAGRRLQANVGRRSSTSCWRALGADRIVDVAIPDYTVTPAGADYGDPVRSTTRSSARQRDHGAPRGGAGSRSSTSSTSRSGGRRTARSSPATGSTRAVRSTPLGGPATPVIELLARGHLGRLTRPVAARLPLTSREPSRPTTSRTSTSTPSSASSTGWGGSRTSSMRRPRRASTASP